MTDTEAAANRRGKAHKALWFGLAIAALALVVGFLVTLPRKTPATQAASDYASAFGGQFTMTDQKGRTVSDRTLRGKPYAIFFGFTRCPDVCPTTLSRMAALRKMLGTNGDKFNIVFVSVDPGHDSARDIDNYLTLFDAPVIGLTGTDAQLARIVDAFHVYYRKVPVQGGDYTIDHTASVFLMDARGRFVTTIDHAESQDVALDKLKRLIAGA
ncbi:SCO family protein [Sphingomonas sp. CJ20]